MQLFTRNNRDQIHETPEDQRRGGFRHQHRIQFRIDNGPVEGHEEVVDQKPREVPPPPLPQVLPVRRTAALSTSEDRTVRKVDVDGVMRLTRFDFGQENVGGELPVREFRIVLVDLLQFGRDLAQSFRADLFGLALLADPG